MKKLLLFLLTFILLPLTSNAANAVSNVDYDIKQDYFLVNIREDGSADVKELIVYDGSFNGVLLNLGFSNPNLSYNSYNYENNAIYNFDDISNIKISAKKLNKVSFDTFNESGFKSFYEEDYASKGDEYVYTLDRLSNEYNIKIYQATHNDSVAFLYEYTLDNIVVMHPDIAEFYWQIFSDQEDRDDIKDVRVRVYLPDSDVKDNFRIWTHDILSSNIKYIEKSGELVGFEASASEVESTDLFDVRSTFSKDLIKDDSNLDYFDGEGFSGILEVEKRRADEANEERARLKSIYNFFKRASQVLTGLVVLGFLIIKFIIVRKPKVDFEADYYREFIEDYNVEVIDYLFKKKLTPNALSAAIMNLVYMKKVEVEELEDSKKKLLSDKKDYKFTLVDKSNLDESDTKLVEFLFDKVGDGKEFTTKKLKSYASSLSTGSTFTKSYTAWNNTVIKNGKQQGFFKSKAPAYLISIPLTILSFFMMTIGGSYGVDYFLVYITFFFALALLIYTGCVISYNEKGTLHFKKWTAFKNFLNDFGSFDVKELPEIKLWERYLVYATIFGIAKKVQKDMNVKIKELDEYGSSYTSNTFTHLYIYDSIRHSFDRAVSDGKKQYAAARANAYSSSSSGGGFGGGGSFGGGFGGGGGGRGGF